MESDFSEVRLPTSSSAMRVLVCGDRNWRDARFIYDILDRLSENIVIDVIIEGDARGVDSIAGYWARKNGIDNLKFPAEWDKYRKSAGPIRNRQMAEDGKPDLVLAFQDDIGNSKGTKDMISVAKSLHIPYLIFTH